MNELEMLLEAVNRTEDVLAYGRDSYAVVKSESMGQRIAEIAIGNGGFSGNQVGAGPYFVAAYRKGNSPSFLSKKYLSMGHATMKDAVLDIKAISEEYASLEPPEKVTESASA